MDNLKQALIENIADILDSEDVQREEVLNGISDPIKRGESELHIRMAEAALAEYKRTCDGTKPDTSENTLPIQSVTASTLTDYDSGLINDYGGGDTGWWMDYIRLEVDAANEHWRQQLNIDE